MESRTQRERHRQLLKFGDRILLAGIDVKGFVSATTALTPQTRLDVLRDKATSPPYVVDCAFEVLHKHQYTERRHLLQTLDEVGINADDNDDDDAEDVFVTGGMEELAKAPRFLGLSENDRQAVTSAKLLYEKERRVNSDEFRRLVGQPIIYGQQVQLKHVATGLLLTVKKTASEVERGALKVVLSSGHQGSWFSVASGYKTKVEGDRVLYNEVLSFMSVAYTGMGLRHSALPIRKESMLPVEVNVNVERTLEITCSLDSTCFKVLPHALHTSLWLKEDVEYLPGCSAVRFVQRSTGGILAVTNDTVHFQEFFSDGLTGQSQRTPGNAVWQLQPYRLEWSGQPGRYLVQYRLIHVFSGKFLAASVNYRQRESNDGISCHLYITPDYSHPDTVWTLHPFVRSDDDDLSDQYLSEESFTFLQHHASGRWLTELHETTPHALFGGKFSEVQTLPAVLETSRRDNYVMAMSQVPAETLAKVVRLRLSLQVMTAFAMDLRTFHKKIPDGPGGLDRDASYAEIVDTMRDSQLPSILRRWGQRVARTLRALVGLVSPGVDASPEEAAAVLEHQLLCRDSRLIDAVMDGLDAVNLRMLFGDEGKQYVRSNALGGHLIRLATLCHMFFQAVCKGGASIQNYIAAFSDKLQPHLGGSVKAADTFAAIYANNMQQVQSADRTIIKSFIDLIRLEGRYPRFVSFLNTLCGWMDSPVPLNQNILVQELLQDSDLVLVKGALVERVDQKGSDWQISWVHRGDGRERAWLCSVLFGKHLDDERAAGIEGWERSEAFIERNPEITMFIYYIFQLQLLCSLCYGRNSNVQKTLLDASKTMKLGIEFDELLAVIGEEALPFVLRTACLRLMLFLHVDSDPWEETLLPRTSRLLHDYTGGGASAESAARLQHKNSLRGSTGRIKDLRDVLVKYLKSLPSQTSTGQASLTLMAVKVLERMFRLGIITMQQAGYREVIDVLLSTLSTVQPMPGGWLTVMETKTHICTTLEFCLALQTEDSLSTLFRGFALARQRAAEESGLHASSGNPAVDDPDDLDNLIAPEDANDGDEGASQLDFAISPAVVNEISSRLQANGADFRFFSLDTFSLDAPAEGPTVLLLELFRFDHPRLTECAARLVEKLLSKRRQLVRCMLDTLIVVDLDTSLMYRRCTSLLRTVNVEFKWVASTDEARKERALARCVVCFQEMTSMLEPNTVVQVPLMEEEGDEGGGDGEALIPSSMHTGAATVRCKAVHLSKARVRSFQSILHDLRATELAMRVLKLPLRRVPQPPNPETGKPQMDLAADTGRRQLFGQVYAFLHHLAAVETPTGALIHNTKIQSYLAAHLDLFISHIGVLNLNVATTLAAIFKANPVLSRRCINAGIIRRFVSLLIDYGEKKRTRWLSFLHNTVVVDGKPVPSNQSVVLNLASEKEDEVLELCKTAEAQAARRMLMAGGCHLVNTESGATAQGSKLAYHRQSVLLLADCALGGDPTLVVKASGFYSLQEVIGGATLGGADADADENIPATTRRYVSSAYWKFLQNVYFATDTENTRVAVREPGNGIWSFDAEAATGGGRTPNALRASGGPPAGMTPAASLTKTGTNDLGQVWLIEWVLQEIRASIDFEPRGALSSDTKYPATILLPYFAFPALTEYFRRHYVQHSAKLSSQHRKQYDSLVEYVKEFGEHIAGLEAAEAAKERAAALKATRALLRAMQTVASRPSAGCSSAVSWMSSALGKSMIETRSRQGGSEQGSALSTTFLSSYAVHRDWRKFIVAFGKSNGIGVYVCPESSDCAEVRPVLPGGPSVKYASLYVMARLFSQPHLSVAHHTKGGPETQRGGALAAAHQAGSETAGERYQTSRSSAVGKPLGWTYEEAVMAVAKLLTLHHETLQWSEEMLVKIIRTLKYAVYLDDGQGTDPKYLQTAWKAAISGEAAIQEPRLLSWVQAKYNALGLTHCAVALMTNSKLSVQLEAIGLLVVLLQGGNRTVQEECHELLTQDEKLSEAWFAQVDAALERCSLWLKQKASEAEEEVVEAVEGEGAEIGEEEEGGEEGKTRLNMAHDPLAFTHATISLLSLLCEGHMQGMQLLMKDQWRNEIKRDLISECVVLLNNMQNQLVEAVATNQPQLPNLIIHIFNFLSEACMGPCYPIQRAIAVESPLILLSNRMFGNIVIEEWDSMETKTFKASILGALLQLLYSLLEGKVDDKAVHMKDVLDFTAVETQMRKMHLLLEHTGSPSGEMQEFLRSVSARERAAAESESEENSDVRSPKASAESRAALMAMPSLIPGENSSRMSAANTSLGAKRGVQFLELKSDRDKKRPTIAPRQGASDVAQAAPSVFSIQKKPTEAISVDEEEVQGEVAKTLLDMLFFMQKLRYVTGSDSLLPSGSASHDVASREAPPDAATVDAEEALRDNLDRFMLSNTASIELLWDNRLEKVYFPLTEMCREVNANAGWRAKVRRYLHALPSDVRANPLQKGIELMRRMETVVSDLVASYELKRKYKMAHWLVERRDIFNKLSFFIALTVLLLMLLTVRQSEATWPEDAPWSYWTCIALCALEVLVTMCIFVGFLCLDFRWWRESASPALGKLLILKLESAAKTAAKAARRRVRRVAPSGLQAAERPEALNFASYLNKGHHKSALVVKHVVKNIPEPPVEQSVTGISILMQYGVIHLLDLVCYWKAWYVGVQIAMACLAAAVSPFFITFQLSIFFLEFDAGRMLVEALKKAGMPLVKTSLMGCVVILVFAVGSFLWFNTAEESLPCQTMYQCVAAHLITGLYGDFAGMYLGGYDELFERVPETIGDEGGNQVRILFVMMFFIIWAFILANIFTGQIVDAFAAIREENENVSNDNITHCLVCSLERFDFDKNPAINFENHVDLEHNAIAYVYYLHYLRVTDKTEFKGYDTAVQKLLDRKAVTDRAGWLPISRSITLENCEDSNKSLEEVNERQTDLLEYLQVTMRRMDMRMRSIEKRLGKRGGGGGHTPAGDRPSAERSSSKGSMLAWAESDSESEEEAIPSSSRRDLHSRETRGELSLRVAVEPSEPSISTVVEEVHHLLGADLEVPSQGGPNVGSENEDTGVARAEVPPIADPSQPPLPSADVDTLRGRNDADSRRS